MVFNRNCMPYINFSQIHLIRTNRRQLQQQTSKSQQNGTLNLYMRFSWKERQTVSFRPILRIYLSIIMYNYQVNRKVSKLMQTQQTQGKPHPFSQSSLLGSSAALPKISKPSSRGHWKAAEQICYTDFLRKNYHIMRSSRLRYHYKIFNAMAEEVGTRTSAQCKSHHQKMLKRAGNRLQNLMVTENSSIPAIGRKQNYFRRMTDQISTNRNYPYFIVHTGKSYLIVIDERYVASY